MITQERADETLLAWSTHQPLLGQTALVSGAATGIGGEIARQLAAHGAAVAINHLNQHVEAAGVSADIEDHGGTVATFTADLRDHRAVTAMTAQIRDQLGPIDILVNNAGDYPRIPWTDLTEDHWAANIESNLTIHYRLTRAVSDTMIARRHGRIINVGSVTASAG
jgi:3-oxoacyl-[acyl-carrier protein] reductase